MPWHVNREFMPCRYNGVPIAPVRTSSCTFPAVEFAVAATLFCKHCAMPLDSGLWLRCGLGCVQCALRYVTYSSYTANAAVGHGW